MQLQSQFTNERLVRKPEACTFLGISSATLDRLVRAEKIRRVKLSDRISAYFLTELMAFAVSSLQTTSVEAVSEDLQ